MDLFRHASAFETHPAGTVLIHQGEPGGRMYVIQEGQVEIRLEDNVLERIGPGGFFGEMSLIDDAPRSATARAATDVRIVPVDEPAFLRMITGTPGFALEVMRTLARRLRNMDALV